jgi:hypothetical protein
MSCSVACKGFAHSPSNSSRVGFLEPGSPETVPILHIRSAVGAAGVVQLPVAMVVVHGGAAGGSGGDAAGNACNCGGGFAT